MAAEQYRTMWEQVPEADRSMRMLEVWDLAFVLRDPPSNTIPDGKEIIQRICGRSDQHPFDHESSH